MMTPRRVERHKLSARNACFVILVLTAAWTWSGGEEPPVEAADQRGEPRQSVDAGADPGQARSQETLSDAPPALRYAFVRARQMAGAEDPRFHVRREGGALSAASPNRGIAARFEADGVVLTSDEALRGTLRTVGLRCDATRADVAGEYRMGERANRVERRVGSDGLEAIEWLESGPLGIEQGFDVPVPSSGGCAELAVALEMEGLSLELTGDAVRLIGDGGALRYAQLFAVDAAGTALPARFAVGEGRIELLVDAEDAVWPVTIDPLVYTEEQAVGPGAGPGNDGRPGDELGRSVAVDGDLAVVGAPFDDVGPTLAQGSVYVFVRSGSSWSHETKLTVPEGETQDYFGYSVALAGNTVLIGAYGGNSAYVFVRSGTTWSQEAKLTASDGAAGAWFGHSVALSGDAALVGAHYDGGTGSAYLFARSGTGWSEEWKLTAGDGAPGDQFGYSVALSGDTALVGAYGDDDGGSSTGSAYVFARSGTTWAEEAKLTATDAATDDLFGWSVALSGDTALIGAPGDDDHGHNSGAAYVFVQTGVSWVQQAKFTAGSRSADDQFGWSTAISADWAVVGANVDDGSAYVFERWGTSWVGRGTLVTAADRAWSHYDHFGWSVALSGDTLLVGAPDVDVERGAAYVFVRSETTWRWEQEAKHVAGRGPARGEFGYTVAMSGDTALVGAPRDQADSGSVYVFVRSGTVWAQQAKIRPTDSVAPRRFGISLALFGDTAMVGTWSRSVYVFVRSGTTWSQQTKLTHTAGLFGRSIALFEDTALVGPGAYVFVRSGTSWALQTRLTGTDAGGGGALAASVAIFGETALVGTPGDDDFGSSSGSAYVFVRSGASWSQEAKLTASDGAAEDRFGASVALSGNTALVGTGAAVGSAYVFVRSGTGWTQEAKLSAWDGAAGDRFGESVALSGDTALVGARDHDALTGAAYLFARSGTTWSPQVKLTASDGAAEDGFGISVALSGTTSLVGAYHYDGPAPYGSLNDGAAYFGTLSTSSDGASCVAGLECASGFCVDGVCCDSACGGGEPDDCQACAIAAGAAADGVCGPSSGNVCDDGLACTTADLCAAGSCVGGSSPCDGTTSCTEAAGGGYACSVCAPGTFSGDGTGATPCIQCAMGTWSVAGATACAAWSDCPPGTYVGEPGTTTMDQVCAECEAGTYSTMANATACLAWAAPPCTATEYESAPPSTVSDRVCSAITTCTAEQYESVPPTSTADRVCSPISVCTSTEYESAPPSTTSDRVCSALTVCDSNEYESTPPTLNTDRVCSPLTVCALGEYESVGPSATSDRVCSALTVCDAMQYESASPSARRDRECSACSVCGEDEREVARCEATMDTVCVSLHDAGIPMLDGGLDGAVDGGGCGCRASGSGGRGLGFTLVLGWLLAWRRRRPRARSPR